MQSSSGTGYIDILYRIPVLVFDTCAVCAAFYKGSQQAQYGALQRSYLMQILVRDSVAYFIASVWLSIATASSTLTGTFISQHRHNGLGKYTHLDICQGEAWLPACLHAVNAPMLPLGANAYY